MATKTTWSRSRTLRFAATTMLVAVILTVIAGLVPNVAAQAATDAPVFQSKLAASTSGSKLAATTDQPLAASFATRARTATVIQPVVVRTSTRSAEQAAPGQHRRRERSFRPERRRDRAGAVDPRRPHRPVPDPRRVHGHLRRCQGRQAIAYYKSGRIVISPSHTASLSRILNHEVWHIIDYRDNGVIDWGENIPPN